MASPSRFGVPAPTRPVYFLLLICISVSTISIYADPPVHATLRYALVGCPARRALVPLCLGAASPKGLRQRPAWGRCARSIRTVAYVASRIYQFLPAVRARCQYHWHAAHYATPPRFPLPLLGLLIIPRCVPYASANTTGAA